MQCPACGTTVAAQAAFCPNCGAPLRAAQSVPAPVSAGQTPYATTVPLSIEQRNWLRANAVLPIVALGASVGGIALIGLCLTGGAFDSPFFATIFFKIFATLVAALLLAVSVAVAIHVRNNRADARAGVAQVRVARLINKRATSGQSRSFYLDFEQIGTLIVMHAIYEPLAVGRTYRVVYSPRSKRGWEATPLDQ